MGNKKVLIVLIFVIVSIIEFSEIVSSCSLSRTYGYYVDPSCSGNTITVYDWWFDLFGDCEMGFAASEVTQLYWEFCDEFGYCGCYRETEAKWLKTGNNGQTCKLRWYSDCSGQFEGKYDASTNTCVKCSGKTKIEQWSCSEDGGKKVDVSQCESACGADACCDDVVPNNYIRETNCKGYCSPDCSFTAWSISINANTTLTTIGKAVRITATTNLNLPSNYYIYIYENGVNIKRCSSGNICTVDVVKNEVKNFNYNAKVVYAVYGYSEDVVTSNTITVNWVQCLSDNDCAGGYKCINNQCLTSCSTDDHCRSGYYCYCGVCSQSWTNGQCSQNQCCNRGYGGSGIGSCVGLGTIYNSGSISYICDSSSGGGGDGDRISP